MRLTGKHYLQPDPALKKGCMKIIAMGIDYLAIYHDYLFQDYACISHPIDGKYMRHLHVEKKIKQKISMRYSCTKFILIYALRYLEY